MSTEYDNEPIPGLPGVPPTGERILWQGSPEWRVLARTAFHTRLVTGYFVLLTGWALGGAMARGIQSLADLGGTALTVAFGIAGVGLLHLLAWGAARSTIYTLTNRRIVLRIGMAMPKCINLPLGLIGSVGLDERADGTGDMPLAVTGAQRLGYWVLWPHARAWHISTPQPMLRAIPQAADVAALIGRTCLQANPAAGRLSLVENAAPIPTFGEAAAA